MTVYLNVCHVVVVYSGSHDSFRRHSFQMPMTSGECPVPAQYPMSTLTSSSTCSFIVPFTLAFLMRGWGDDNIGKFDDDLYRSVFMSVCVCYKSCLIVSNTVIINKEMWKSYPWCAVYFILFYDKIT